VVNSITHASAEREIYMHEGAGRSSWRGVEIA
jgi:hypothetical protein